MTNIFNHQMGGGGGSSWEREGGGKIQHNRETSSAQLMAITEMGEMCDADELNCSGDDECVTWCPVSNFF